MLETIPPFKVHTTVWVLKGSFNCCFVEKATQESKNIIREIRLNDIEIYAK